MTTRRAVSRFYSRPGRDITKRFPYIAEAIARLPRKSIVRNGELVAFNDDGRPDFHLLSRKRIAVVAFLFDIMECNGADLRGKPWLERWRYLDRLIQRNRSEDLRVTEVRKDGVTLRAVGLAPNDWRKWNFCSALSIDCPSANPSAEVSAHTKSIRWAMSAPGKCSSPNLYGAITSSRRLPRRVNRVGSVKGRLLPLYLHERTPPTKGFASRWAMCGNPVPRRRLTRMILFKDRRWSRRNNNDD